MSEGLIGRRLPRLEDPALLTGRGRFVDDIHIPGTLEAAFVRSPHPHARITRVDATAARRHPGVHAVYAYADLAPHLTANLIPADNRHLAFEANSRPPVLPVDEVCFVGEAVAIVVADSRYVAEDALALVEVDYDPVPGVSDCRAALAPGAPLAHLGAADNVVKTFQTAFGDCDAAFAGAPHVATISLKQHRGSAHSIEGRGVLARPDPVEDRLTVWSSTQGSHRVRNTLVELLRLDEDRVRVIVPDVGGAFGAKHIVYPEEVIVALAARLLGRPVKWIEDRREHFLAAVQERDQYWELEVAADRDGRLRGIRGRMIHDQGAYTLLGMNVPLNASLAMPGPYLLPAYQLDVTVVATNRVGVIPVRGAGYPEGVFAMERVMDSLARDLGLDRAEVRRRNLIPPERIPFDLPLKSRDGTVTRYDSGDFPLCQAKALAAADYAGFPARQETARAEGRYRGIGLANAVKITGRGPFETAIVRIGPSGKVTVHTGAMPMGQGTVTSFAQICADVLGLAPEDVTVVAGDTATVSLGIGGFGSRQTVNAGSSLLLAAREVRAKALAVGALVLEAAAEDLELRGGAVWIKGTDRQLPFAEIARALGGGVGYARPKDVSPGLEATGNFMPPDVTYGNACHVVEVEVDVGTGAVQILRYVVVNDSGKLINPMIVEGQIIGGVAHGIGNALFEWMGYDEGGQPLTTNFGEYLLPTAPVVPEIEIHHVVTPSTVNPLGVKGVGEAGVIPAAAAIIAAVENALEPFGVTLAEAPISPGRLVELMAAGRS
ncbi:MAG: xanthine dehydrogenase family protein molybdopterin-binding subunit [Alphaproteobacteria bacterium]|nr:xanthine dehydrogenase family protein molybdopterin-binding subunit [Alphaproteobacteria bacterium]